MDYIYTSLSWYDITDLMIPIMNWLYDGCLLRYMNSLPFASTWVQIRVLVWSALLFFSVSCVVCVCVFCCCFFLRRVFRAPNVASVSGFSSSCVSCAQSCQCLGVVHCWLPLLFSLTRKLLNQALLLICLHVTKQPCHTWPWLCSVCRNQNIIRSSGL